MRVSSNTATNIQQDNVGTIRIYIRGENIRYPVLEFFESLSDDNTWTVLVLKPQPYLGRGSCADRPIHGNQLSLPQRNY